MEAVECLRAGGNGKNRDPDRLTPCFARISGFSSSGGAGG
jgi:hypothetical protein